MKFATLIAVVFPRSPLSSWAGANSADQNWDQLRACFRLFLVYSDESCSIRLDKQEVSLARRVSPFVLAVRRLKQSRAIKK